MKEMRLASFSDVGRLKEIWKLCFGDSDFFVDFYFAQRFKPEQVAVCLIDNVLVAMLTMIPVQGVKGLAGQKSINASMLYAIATHPEYQKQGIAKGLMDWAAEYLKDNGVELCVLVPAEAQLFDFYKRLGYEEGFTVKEAVLSKEQITFLHEAPSHESDEVSTKSLGKAKDWSGQVYPAAPQDYNRIRNQLLQGSAYIAYGEEEIAYQKKVSQLSGADLYGINVYGVQGCAAVERLNEEKVLVKEFLLPEEFLYAGLKALAQNIQTQEFIIRTPSGWGEALEGQSRSFGMLKRTNFYESEQSPEQEEKLFEKMAYLGLAFD